MAGTIIQERNAFQSEVPILISKVFNAHAPKIIEVIFKHYVQTNVIQVHPMTTTSTDTTSSAELQQQMYLRMNSNFQDQANDLTLWDLLKHEDAPPEGEKRVKRHKTSKRSKSVKDKPNTSLIYLKRKDEKRVMYLVENVKFCDATLGKVLNEVKLRIFQNQFWKKPPRLGSVPCLPSQKLATHPLSEGVKHKTTLMGVPLSHSHWKSTMAGALHQYLAGLTLVDRLSLDYGLHPLNVDADVLKMAKYVKDYKIILVYVEHRSSIFVTPKKGVSIAVDNHLRKGPIEIDSSPNPSSYVEAPIVVECADDPFEDLDEILGDYAYIRKQITGNEITGKQLVVHVGNSSTINDVLDLEMLSETQEVGLFGKFKEIEVDANNESKKESDTEGDYTSGSDSDDSDNDLKYDEVFDDDEHIVEDVHEDDLDVINYDSFNSNLDNGIDFERGIHLRFQLNNKAEPIFRQSQMKWKLTGIPCKHVVAAIYNMSKNSVGVAIPEQWVHAVYKLETWAHVYSFKVNPCNGREIWLVVEAKTVMASARQAIGARTVSCQACGASNVASQSGGFSRPIAAQSTSTGARNASSQPSATSSTASQGPTQHSAGPRQGFEEPRLGFLEVFLDWVIGNWARYRGSYKAWNWRELL
nr:transposase, mutator type [Tanacetum cinerariifolium]